MLEANYGWAKKYIINLMVSSSLVEESCINSGTLLGEESSLQVNADISSDIDPDIRTQPLIGLVYAKY